MAMAIAIATGKKSGITTQNSIVTRHITCLNLPQTTKIIDYGSGFNAWQSRKLQRQYPYIRAFDYPTVIDESIKKNPNLAFIFDKNPFRESADIVMLSNVLNVQSSVSDIRTLLKGIYCNMPIKSRIVFNLPNDPIKLRNTTPSAFRSIVINEIQSLFGSSAVKISTACNTPVKYLFEIKKESHSDLICKEE